jgi:hypothetical protein
LKKSNSKYLHFFFLFIVKLISLGNANRRIHISFDNTAGGEDHGVPNTTGTAPLGFMGQGNAAL